LVKHIKNPLKFYQNREKCETQIFYRGKNVLKLNLLNLRSAMKLKQAYYLFLCLTLVAGVSSCSSSKEDKAASSEEFGESEELKSQIEDIVYNIPSPSEIPYLLEATGAEFNQSLINPKENASKYTSRTDRAAMNLGVYAADIGYLTSYDKTQEAIDYLNACRSIADNLNLTGTFDESLLKEFEQNINNKDSLTRLLDRTIKKTEMYLKDDNRNKLSSLVIAGSFIESLYISTGLIKSYPRNILPDDQRNLVLTPLMRIVLEQKKSVSELVQMLSAVEQTEPVVAMLKDLKELEQTYQQLNIEEQIKNNRADLVLTDKNLEGITNIVERLRKGITG